MTAGGAEYVTAGGEAPYILLYCTFPLYLLKGL
jgi:hypothetical protein